MDGWLSLGVGPGKLTAPIVVGLAPFWKHGGGVGEGEYIGDPKDRTCPPSPG